MRELGESDKVIEMISAPEARFLVRLANGEEMELPAQLVSLLVQKIDQFPKSIEGSERRQVTTQQAADFLGMSRPSLVKLLESRRIPFTQTEPGGHRRVQLADLIEFKESIKKEKDEKFSEIIRVSQEAGLYELETSEEYLQNIKRLRQGKARNKEAIGPGRS